jgi:hypothetical protein
VNRTVWASLWKVCVLLVLAVLPFSAEAANEKHFLKNLRIEGTLADGGTFKGKFSVTRFAYDATKGLTVDGFLHGTVTTASGQVLENFEQSVTGIPATLNEGTAAGVSTQAVCDILTLDVGAIHLDLLGLVLDLAPINLDLAAVSGSGNLLGNLLCAVAGLLDPLGFLDTLSGTLENLLGVLDAINGLIG